MISSAITKYFSLTRIRLSRIAVIFIGLILAGYVTYLVIAQYRAQVHLHTSSIKQINYESERRAIAISYFYLERVADLERLAESRELSAYFENKALEMSMLYGLQASITIADNLFDRSRQQKKLGGKPIFNRIIFVNKAGELVNDSIPKSYRRPDRSIWQSYFSSGSVKPVFFSDKQNTDPQVIVSVPCFFKNRHVGQIIGWISSSLVYRYFIEDSDAPSRYPTIIAFGREYHYIGDKSVHLVSAGLPLNSQTIRQSQFYDMAAFNDDNNAHPGYTISIPVDKTPLSLLTYIPPPNFSHLQSPRQLLYLTGGVALFILAVMFFLLRLDMRNAVLSTHLKETVLREREVEEKNRQLATENHERQAAEALLRESEEKYRIVVENALEAIVIVQDMQMAFINKTALNLSGYSKEALASSPFTDFIHPEDMETVVHYYARLMMGENILQRPCFRIICADGLIKWAEINSVLIPWQGRPAALSFLIDITDSKRMAEESEALAKRLQRAEKMEALGTMAGGIAHDLNNVLGVIVGYAEMLIHNLGDPNRLKARILTIFNASERAAAIVQDMLTLARRGVQNREVLNLNKSIQDFQNTPEFEKLVTFNPKVQMKTNLEADLFNIMGSPIHIGKTIMNLLANAIEAMPAGGDVIITTRNQYLDRIVHGYDDVREGDYVVLSIADSGEGIPSQDLNRIFEPFYTKKVMGRSGTGLGLAVVWGTVKDHNGYINVESEVGKGTTFSLYFPMSREDSPEKQKALAIPEYAGSGESILIIDDSKEQQELATWMLSHLNYNVNAASSGEEAVEFLKTNRTDLVILDMIMDPGMDGLDTYRRILQMHPEQKAIIVSGFSENERVTKVQELGAGAYVRKPYAMEKLGLAVKNELTKVH